MSIKASDVAELRKITGVGIMEAKNALTEAGGDIEKSIELLRKRGAAKAAKKSGRATAEGRAHTYTHSNGKIGVVVELLCETDFVAINEEFINTANDIAMHIAAMSPLYTSREDVPKEVVDKEREILKDQLLQEGKPEDMLDKIMEGKMNKYFEEICLLEQKFIKDEDMTIQQLIEKKVLSLGENIQLKRFSRIQIGEGKVTPKTC